MFHGTEYEVVRKAAVAVLFIAAFLAGRMAAHLTADSALGRESASAEQGSDALSVPASTEGSWGLSFQQEGEPPVANATMEELAQYDAYYASDTDEKVIYLTFDCGYENGNTPAILEALNKHGVSATFFVVGNFVSDQPELVCQMLEEGHTVGNHTAHHPDMSAISDLESFQAEIEELETLFTEATGQEITKYYRPPQGKYSQSNLAMAQELGYKTFFWSLAYVDWYQDDQPTEEEAFEKLLGRIHPGAIVLLHNTSSTNAAILDELLTKWEEMGYRFGKLEELL
ncbi:MAG: polysaccharide deacetylase family protein [Lachnospiraceae bacterium]|nr:polysaccharide deacetylase family protein [Lachnospiraceae bacterium]